MGRLQIISFWRVSILLLLSNLVTADTNTQRFTSFYSSMNSLLLPISNQTCRPTLQTYLDSPFTKATANLCYDQIRCILSNLPEDEKSDEASASVLLGILPTFLSFLGPTIPEVALLSSRRPFLALILSFGSVSVSVDRFASFSSPVEILRREPGSFAIRRFQSTLKPFVINIVEYGFGLATIANIMFCVIKLGMYTVLNWKCQFSFMPLFWTLIPCIIHAISAVSFRLSMAMKEIMAIQHDVGKRKGTYCNVINLLEQECKPCANQPSPALFDRLPDEGFLVVSLQWLASGIAFIHILFGTLVLSSLLFIGMVQALEVVCQITGSVVVCRAILMFELAGLREDYPGTDTGSKIQQSHNLRES